MPKHCVEMVHGRPQALGSQRFYCSDDLRELQASRYSLNNNSHESSQLNTAEIWQCPDSAKMGRRGAKAPFSEVLGCLKKNGGLEAIRTSRVQHPCVLVNGLSIRTKRRIAPSLLLRPPLSCQLVQRTDRVVGKRRHGSSWEPPAFSARERRARTNSCASVPTRKRKGRSPKPGVPGPEVKSFPSLWLRKRNAFQKNVM